MQRFVACFSKMILFVFAFLPLSAISQVEDSARLSPLLFDFEFPDHTIYVYNGSKDTIHLVNLEIPFFVCDSFAVAKEIQIDGKGSPEVVIRRGLRYGMSEHGGTFDMTDQTTIVHYEIWNTDTKTLLFSAINNYVFEYDYFKADFPKNLDKKGIDRYSYEFIILENGDIRIRNYRHSRNAKSDHIPGLYCFTNGKYLRDQ